MTVDQIYLFAEAIQKVNSRKNKMALYIARVAYHSKDKEFKKFSSSLDPIEKKNVTDLLKDFPGMVIG